MDEITKIKLSGNQPAAKISDDLLKKLIIREFDGSANTVRIKLRNVISNTSAGKNRISACILKLANQDLIALDDLIEKANFDSRDIIKGAEYPRCAKIGFSELDKGLMKQIYIDDFIEYSNWLNHE